MKDEKRRGEQFPSVEMVHPYEDTLGDEALELYNSTGRTALPWQEILIRNIMAVDEEELFIHSKYGYSVPRQNGKSGILVIRELEALRKGERVLHTAHRTSTSHASWERIVDALAKTGYVEGVDFKSLKQFGLERIEMLGDNPGKINFRTRSSKGGLGESYDLLIIDEAQEYTDDQESALKYVIAASRNPQTIMCGTPPTTVSAGTIFTKYRQKTLAGEVPNGGWAEWSVEKHSDINDKDLWYKTNPSLGYVLTERNIAAELGGDPLDLNIQRLGLWVEYNQKSEISLNEWRALKTDKLPELCKDKFVGVKFGVDGENMTAAISAKTKDGKVFVEALGCRKIKEGFDWIMPFLKNPNIKEIVIDGANGQKLLADRIEREGIKAKVILPKVMEVISANASFEGLLYKQGFCHMGQPALENVASNCKKRAIGTQGGFGYKSILDGAEIGLLDSVILALWRANQEEKRKKKQRISY